MTHPLKNFVIYGTPGDIIWSLSVIKMIGGGNMYMKLNYLDEFCRNKLNWHVNPPTNRPTINDYNNIAPLLNVQSYINTVDIWQENIPIDYDLLESNLPYVVSNGWQGNQTQIYGLAMGLDITDPEIERKLYHEPWLEIVDPIRVPGKYIVINRTPRYRDPGPHQYYIDLYQRGIMKYAIFVGTSGEHQDFQKEHNITIDYYPTANLLDLAKVIQGCEYFIGNQSCPHTIAVALGKSYQFEPSHASRLPTPHGAGGDCWFPRINGKFF